MVKIKYIFSTLILALLIILTGCTRGDPIYVDSILVYENDMLLTGGYKYHDGNKWVDYDNEKSTKEKVYYSVDVKDRNIKVVFNIYAPNTKLKTLKLSINSNLSANTKTVFIEDNIENIDGLYSCPFELDFTNEFNAISVSGFATSDGLKYMGAKSSESNFVLYGVYLNLIDQYQ